MATSRITLVAGTGAIGACLLGAMLLAPSGVGDGPDGGGTSPIQVEPPPSLIAAHVGVNLPLVPAEDAKPVAGPVPGGAPAGQAGIWSKPARFAPPEEQAEPSPLDALIPR